MKTPWQTPQTTTYHPIPDKLTPVEKDWNFLKDNHALLEIVDLISVTQRPYHQDNFPRELSFDQIKQSVGVDWWLEEYCYK